MVREGCVCPSHHTVPEYPAQGAHVRLADASAAARSRTYGESVSCVFIHSCAVDTIRLSSSALFPRSPVACPHGHTSTIDTGKAKGSTYWIVRSSVRVSEGHYDVLSLRHTSSSIPSALQHSAWASVEAARRANQLSARHCSVPALHGRLGTHSIGDTTLAIPRGSPPPVDLESRQGVGSSDVKPQGFHIETRTPQGSYISPRRLVLPYDKNHSSSSSPNDRWRYRLRLGLVL